MRGQLTLHIASEPRLIDDPEVASSLRRPAWRAAPKAFMPLARSPVKLVLTDHHSLGETTHPDVHEDASTCIGGQPESPGRGIAAATLPCDVDARQPIPTTGAGAKSDVTPCNDVLPHKLGESAEQAPILDPGRRRHEDPHRHSRRFRRPQRLRRSAHRPNPHPQFRLKT